MKIEGSQELELELEELEHLDFEDEEELEGLGQGGLVEDEVLVGVKDDEQSEQSEQSELSESDEILISIHFLKLESIDLIHSLIKELDEEFFFPIFALEILLFLTNLSNSILVDGSELLFEIFFNFLSTSKF